MATIKEVKKELRHREWAEEIAECQSSGIAGKHTVRYSRRYTVSYSCVQFALVVAEQ